MKNKPVLNIFILLTAMLLTVVAFIYILLFLKDINDAIQIILILLSILLFCFLDARFLVLLSNKVNAGSGVICNYTEIQSSSQLFEILNDMGFTAYTYGTSISSNMEFLRKIVHKNGSYITDVIIQKTMPSESEFSTLDHEIQNVSFKSDKESRVQVIRQKNTVLCVFDYGMTEESIMQFISRFSYTFSVFLPVVIDTQKGRIYHSEIPLNRPFAKGKALADLLRFVSSTLYMEGK